MQKLWKYRYIFVDIIDVFLLLNFRISSAIITPLQLHNRGVVASQINDNFPG